MVICSSIHQLTNPSQTTSDPLMLQTPSEGSSPGLLYQISHDKECKSEKVEKVRSLGFYCRLFLVPKPGQKWSPYLNRLNALLDAGKIQNGNSRVHKGPSDSKRMGLLNRLYRHLSPHSPPLKFKKVPMVYPQISKLPIHPFVLRASNSPTSHCNDSRRSEAYGPPQGKSDSTSTCTIGSSLHHLRETHF